MTDKDRVLSKEIYCSYCHAGQDKFLWGARCPDCGGTGKITKTTTIKELIDNWRNDDE